MIKCTIVATFEKQNALQSQREILLEELRNLLVLILIFFLYLGRYSQNRREICWPSLFDMKSIIKFMKMRMCNDARV